MLRSKILVINGEQVYNSSSQCRKKLRNVIARVGFCLIFSNTVSWIGRYRKIRTIKFLCPYSEATEIVDNEEFIHVPKRKLVLSEVEENIAFELALSSKNTQTIRKLPIKVDDVIDALTVSFITLELFI